MKIVICPSSPEFMPYLRLYNENINEAKMIIWERSVSVRGQERGGNFSVYRDKKEGHSRGPLDYLRFGFYVYKWLGRNTRRGDTCLVFGFQLLWLLWPVMWLRGLTWLVDIRDYHFLYRWIPTVIYRKSKLCIVSSPTYKELLPNGCRVVVSHNYLGTRYKLKRAVKAGPPYIISCIGMIRDYSANLVLVEKLKNNRNFILEFHGEGDASRMLKAMVDSLDARNVAFTGYYRQDEEASFFNRADIINILLDEGSYSYKFALANRMYNALALGIPIVCSAGSLTAQYVEKYRVGICLEKDEDWAIKLLGYLNLLDYNVFAKGIQRFFESVSKDRLEFVEAVKNAF